MIKNQCSVTAVLLWITLGACLTHGQSVLDVKLLKEVAKSSDDIEMRNKVKLYVEHLGFRDWNAKKGDFQVKARYCGINLTTMEVALKRFNGTMIEAGLTAISEEDVRFINATLQLENEISNLLMKKTESVTGEMSKLIESTQNRTSDLQMQLAQAREKIEKLEKSQKETLPNSVAGQKQWAAHTTNSIGMKFVMVPAGDFMMGSDPYGEKKTIYLNEELQHRVYITKPFLLGQYEVNQLQYKKVTGKNPSHFKGDSLPVEHLSWEQASQFCKQLSALPEEKRAGRSYRLPTEAEWEYACRAGTKTTFHTGDSLLSTQAKFAAGYETIPQQTATVGSFPPNPWGLYDMHGNVWEWTGDWFSADYYKISPSKNPKGPANGTHHTLRGGSASVKAEECYAAIRGEAAGSDGPNPLAAMRFEKIGDFGLRLVCEINR